MKNKYDMILAAEQAFARQIALGVIVTTPQSVWHYLIPFMFMFDFLRRGTTIRRYTEHFMFPRKLAIDAAQDLIEAGDKEERVSRIREEIRVWLDNLHLYSQTLQETQMKVVTSLMNHYGKLFQTDGDTYHELVRNAYMDRDNYKAYLAQLTALEKEVDRAILEKLGETEKLREKIFAEQDQLQRMRQKRVNEIF